MIKLLSYPRKIFFTIRLAIELVKGGDDVLALLFASRVITGRTNFSEIPVKLQPKVRQILVEEGLEELCNE